MADETTTFDESKIIRFFHGNKAGIQAKIDEGAITGSDFVVSKDTDELIFIDVDKNQKPLVSRSKMNHVVNIGEGNTVGGIKDGDTVEGGIDLDELIEKLTRRSVPPKYEKPGITCMVSAGTAAGIYEAGTNIATTIQGIYVKNDGGLPTKTEVLRDGVSIAVQESQATSISIKQAFQIGVESTDYSVRVNYAEGPLKTDNLGDPCPQGHVLAGTVASTAVNFSGKRGLFYGTGVGDIPEITSSMVRNLGNIKLGPEKEMVFDIPVAAGQQYVVFAYPEMVGDVEQIEYVEAGDAMMAPCFDEHKTLVEGANGFVAISYNVYTYKMAVPAISDMTFRVTI